MTLSKSLISSPLSVVISLTGLLFDLMTTSIKNEFIFNCHFLWKVHSGEQTPFIIVFPPGIHWSAVSTEALWVIYVLLKDTTYWLNSGLNCQSLYPEIVFLSLQPTCLIKSLLLQTHLNHRIVAINPTYVSKPTTYRTVRNIANIYHLLLNFPMYQSFYLLKRRNSFVTVCALLEKRAPPFLLNVSNHNFFSWFVSIGIDF